MTPLVLRCPHGRPRLTSNGPPRCAGGFREHLCRCAESDAMMATWSGGLRRLVMRVFHPRQEYWFVNGTLVPGKPGDQSHEVARRLLGAGPSELAQEAVPPSWLERCWHALFPQAPRPRIDGDARTYITMTVHTRVGWADRLRVLATGRVRLQVVTYTDVEVHEAEAVSVFDVPPPGSR